MWRGLGAADGILQAVLPENMRKASSTCRELASLRVWLQVIGRSCTQPRKPRPLFFVSDSTAAVSLLFKCGSPKKDCCRELEAILTMAEQQGWVIYPLWTRRSTPLLQTCDRLSRIEAPTTPSAPQATSPSAFGFISAAQVHRSHSLHAPFLLRRTVHVSDPADVALGPEYDLDAPASSGSAISSVSTDTRPREGDAPSRSGLGHTSSGVT